MAAAGLRPCHLTSTRNSTVSQFNVVQAASSSGDQQPALNQHHRLSQSRLTQLQQQQQQQQQPMHGSNTSCALSHGSASQMNLLFANNSDSVDEKKLVMSQQKLNLICMIQFATSLMNALNGINKQSFQLFKLRVGVNTGPVIAGVIGAQRPFYDIWGDCVNVSVVVGVVTLLYSNGQFKLISLFHSIKSTQ